MPELRQRQPKTSTPTSTRKPQGQKEIVKGNIHPGQEKGHASAMLDRGPDDPRVPLLGLQAAKQDTALSQRQSSTSPPSLLVAHEQENSGAENMENLSRKSQWIVLALASGACAAFNGVFAKLTTTELTTNFATAIANLIGLSKIEGGVEVVIRAIFFGLNLIFNGIMWALFTKALARGTSTTQVSILNTSSNFMITAILGFLIFSESLPPLWFLGAALLVAGNVIIGRRDEGESKVAGVVDVHERAENGEGQYSEEEGLLEAEEMELDEDLELERKKREEEDVLQLDLEENHGNSRGQGPLI